MTTFRQAIETITGSVRWLRGYYAQRFTGFVGLTSDMIAEAAGLAVRVGWLDTPDSPDDVLPTVGRSRSLPRAGTEPNAFYRTRLLNAWTIWGRAGTPSWAALALSPLGVSEVSVKYAHGAGTWKHFGSNDWFSAWDVIAEATNWTITYIDDGEWTIGGTDTIGSTATVDELRGVRDHLNQTKAGHEVGHQFIIANSNPWIGDFNVNDGTEVGGDVVPIELGQFVGGEAFDVVGGGHPLAIGHPMTIGTIL
jgi:hypothetical protein